MSVLVEVPYIYGIEGVLPRKQNPSCVGVLDTVPVHLHEYESAPVAVRVHTRRRPGLLVAEKGHMVRDQYTLDYLGLEGGLWRPVIIGNDLSRVSEDISPLVTAWLATVVIGKNLCPEIGGCLDTGHSYTRVSRNGSVFREHFRQAELPAVKDIQWTDRALQAEKAARKAERDFIYVGGVLHLRTQGPVWFVENLNPGDKRPIGIQLDGIRSSPNDPAYFPADRRDLADLWQAELGKAHAGYEGGLEIPDAELYRSCVPPDNGLLLSAAARALLTSQWFDYSYNRMPHQLFSAIGELGKLYADGDFVTVRGDYGYVEDVLREIESYLPLISVSGNGTVERVSSPITAYLRSAEWRIRADASMLPDETPRGMIP
jgi:hypothetical protein